MNRYSGILVSTLLLAAPAAARAQDAAAFLNDAAKAMHIENVHTVRYTATGSAYAIGQSYVAGGPYPRSSMEFTRELDLDGFTGQQQFVNTRVDDRGGGLPNRVGAQVRQVQNLSRSQPWPRHVFMWLTPVGFVKEAPKHNPVLTTERVGGKRYDVITVKVDKYTLRGLFNERHLLEKVETVLGNNPVLGVDVPLDSVFTGYRDFSGVTFPDRIVHYLGAQPSFDFSITTVTPNAPLSPPPTDPAADLRPDPPVRVVSQTVGKGVHYLTGGTHHSVAVEFADYVIVIDAPLSEERSLAVMAEVKKLAPNKPIRYVINTHHHFDHSNGLRTYAAEGVTIVTHPRNAAFYRRWWAKPPVVIQDRLSQSGKKAVFETVSGRKVYSDREQTLELYEVRNTRHVEGMLVAYLPKEKILVEPDLFTPPAPGAAPAPTPAPPGPDRGATELEAAIAGAKIDVQRILPLHGPGLASRADLDRAAGGG